MDAMLRALRENLVGAEWIEPEGGYFISTKLPESINGGKSGRIAANSGSS